MGPASQGRPTDWLLVASVRQRKTNGPVACRDCGRVLLLASVEQQRCRRVAILTCAFAVKQCALREGTGDRVARDLVMDGWRQRERSAGNREGPHYKRDR